MANAITIDNTKTDSTQNHFIFYGTMVLSGSYATGGETPDYTQVQATGTADWIDVASLAGYAWVYTFTDAKIRLNDSAGTEHAAGAYAGGITGDTVRVRIWMKKL